RDSCRSRPRRRTESSWHLPVRPPSVPLRQSPAGVEDLEDGRRTNAAEEREQTISHRHELHRNAELDGQWSSHRLCAIEIDDDESIFAPQRDEAAVGADAGAPADLAHRERSARTPLEAK